MTVTLQKMDLGGAQRALFRRFFFSNDSMAMFSLMFWYCHCKARGVPWLTVVAHCGKSAEQPTGCVVAFPCLP